MGSVNLSIIFQWHKLLHFILPLIAIVALQKRLGLAKVCMVMFMLGCLKEIYDIIIMADPLMVSIMDTVFNVIGIASGIVSAKLICKLCKRSG